MREMHKVLWKHELGDGAVREKGPPRTNVIKDTTVSRILPHPTS